MDRALSRRSLFPPCIFGNDIGGRCGDLSRICTDGDAHRAALWLGTAPEEAGGVLIPPFWQNKFNFMNEISSARARASCFGQRKRWYAAYFVAFKPARQAEW